jgi:hypothetical protein
MRGTVVSKSVTQCETHNWEPKTCTPYYTVKAPAALYCVMPLKPRGKLMTAEFFPLLILVPSHGRVLLPLRYAWSADLRMLLRGGKGGPCSR